jgi:hypothetical protein
LLNKINSILGNNVQFIAGLFIIFSTAIYAGPLLHELEGVPCRGEVCPLKMGILAMYALPDRFHIGCKPRTKVGGQLDTFIVGLVKHLFN